MDLESPAPKINLEPQQIAALADVLNTLEQCAIERGEPTHEGQRQFISSFFLGKTLIISIWGRRAGKTEALGRLLWAWARLFPGSISYFFAAENVQAHDILWAPNRIQTIGPKEWIKEELKSEMRLKLESITGETSQIKLGGADRFDKRRGIEPSKHGLVVLDEFREYKDDFWYTIKPILARYNAPIGITTTPPKHLDDSVDPSKPCLLLREIERAKKSKRGAYFHFPSHINPGLSEEFLAQEKADLIADGKEDVWRREYLGEFVRFTHNSVFPQFQRERHVHKHDTLIEELKRQSSSLEWYCICDPAAGSVFAWMFIAFNAYTKKVYVLEEIYEKDKSKTPTPVIWPEARRTMEELLPNRPPEGPDWRRHYDEAELWFQVQIKENFDVEFAPTWKYTRSKEDGIDLMQSTIARDSLAVSDRCIHFIWEMERYEVDTRGRYPKRDDHQIDNFRAFQRVSNYSLPERDRTEGMDRREAIKRRVRFLEDDIREEASEEDWTEAVFTIGY